MIAAKVVSILAETILNRAGAGRFVGYSAGSQPKGSVHPLARSLLADLGHDTAALRSQPDAEADGCSCGTSITRAPWFAA